MAGPQARNIKTATQQHHQQKEFMMKEMPLKPTSMHPLIFMAKKAPV